jgi:cyclase
VKARPDVAALNRDAPEPPRQLINEGSYLLNDGDRKVEFRYFGWGHTRGDGYVYLPKDQVLCTGDAAVNGPYNNFRDANIANWPEVLAKVGKLKISFVLPGHGMMGGREILDGQEEFLRDLYQAVKKRMDAGENLETIQAGLKLPGAVQAWESQESLAKQAADVYQEIKQGKPRGDL